jgi:hypothetical protein
MSDRNRLLQEAWRDLVGWHPGMVMTDGYVFDQHMDAADADDELPDLESPANWGHWEDWCLQRGWSVEVVPDDDGTYLVYVDEVTREDWCLQRGWSVEVVPDDDGTYLFYVDEVTSEGLDTFDSKPRALLHALHARMPAPDWAELPPAVLAWWEAEQNAGRR